MQLVSLRRSDSIFNQLVQALHHVPFPAGVAHVVALYFRREAVDPAEVRGGVLGMGLAPNAAHESGSSLRRDRRRRRTFFHPRPRGELHRVPLHEWLDADLLEHAREVLARARRPGRPRGVLPRNRPRACQTRRTGGPGRRTAPESWRGHRSWRAPRRGSTGGAVRQSRVR